jgi:hypothetical protein
MDQLVSQQANPASDITQPCQNPVELVAAPSGGDVLRNWSKDRAALLDCREKRAALWGYVQGRGAGLSNATPANPPKPGG